MSTSPPSTPDAPSLPSPPSTTTTTTYPQLRWSSDLDSILPRLPQISLHRQLLLARVQCMHISRHYALLGTNNGHLLIFQHSHPRSSPMRFLMQITNVALPASTTTTATASPSSFAPPHQHQEEAEAPPHALCCVTMSADEKMIGIATSPTRPSSAPSSTSTSTTSTTATNGNSTTATNGTAHTDTEGSTVHILEFTAQKQQQQRTKHGMAHSMRSIAKHTEHARSGGRVTSLHFAADGKKLLSGDEQGTVYSMLTSRRVLFKSRCERVLREEGCPIVQMHGSGELLLVSTTRRVVMVNMDAQFYRGVGKKERDGRFGACFQWGPTPRNIIQQQNLPKCHLTEFIYAARPARRMWCSEKISGTVLSTLKYLKVQDVEEHRPNLKFGEVHPFGPYLISWTDEVVSIVNVKRAIVVEFHNEFVPIHKAAASNSTCLILHGSNEPDNPLCLTRVIILEKDPGPDNLEMEQEVVEEGEAEDESVKKRKEEEKLVGPSSHRGVYQEETTAENRDPVPENESKEDTPASVEKDKQPLQRPSSMTSLLKPNLDQMKNRLGQALKSAQKMAQKPKERLSTEDSALLMSSKQDQSHTDLYEDVAAAGTMRTQEQHANHEREGVLEEEEVLAEKGDDKWIEPELVITKAVSKKRKKSYKGRKRRGSKMKSSAMESDTVSITDSMLSVSRVASMDTLSVTDTLTSDDVAPSTTYDDLSETALSTPQSPIEQANPLPPKNSPHPASTEDSSKQPIAFDNTETSCTASDSSASDVKDEHQMPDEVNRTASQEVGNPRDIMVEPIEPEKPVLDYDKEMYEQKMEEALSLYETLQTSVSAEYRSENFAVELEAFVEFVVDECFVKSPHRVVEIMDITMAMDSREQITSLVMFHLKHLLTSLSDQEEEDNVTELMQMIEKVHPFVDLCKLFQVCNRSSLSTCIHALLSLEERMEHLKHERTQMDNALHVLHTRKNRLKSVDLDIDGVLGLMHKSCIEGHISIAIRYLPQVFNMNPASSLRFCMHEYPMLLPWNVQDAISVDGTPRKTMYLRYLMELHNHRIESRYEEHLMFALADSLISHLTSQEQENTQDETTESYRLLLDRLTLECLNSEIALNIADLERLVRTSGSEGLVFRFCELTGKHSDVVRILVARGDMPNLADFMMKHCMTASLWTDLLQMVHNASTMSNNDQTRKITKEGAVFLMCQCIGSMHTLQVLGNAAEYCANMHPSVYSKICELAQTENSQSKLKHEMLETIDSYMWAEKDSVLSPQTRALIGPVLTRFTATRPNLTTGSIVRANSARVGGRGSRRKRLGNQSSTQSHAASEHLRAQELLSHLKDSLHLVNDPDAATSTEQHSWPNIMETHRGNEGRDHSSNAPSIGFRQSSSLPRFAEDSSVHWGIELPRAVQHMRCPSCKLPITEEVSTNELIIFACGHVYHRLCSPMDQCTKCEPYSVQECANLYK